MVVGPFNSVSSGPRLFPELIGKKSFASHCRLLFLSDISEMESYHSYSPQDDQRSRQSDLSSHSSNDAARENAR